MLSTQSTDGGWSGDLVACEFDAQDMAAIAHAAGMSSKLLLNQESYAGKRARSREIRILKG